VGLFKSAKTFSTLRKDFILLFANSSNILKCYSKNKPKERTNKILLFLQDVNILKLVAYLFLMKYTLKSKKYLLETIKLKIPIKPSGQYCLNPNKIDLARH